MNGIINQTISLLFSFSLYFCLSSRKHKKYYMDMHLCIEQYANAFVYTMHNSIVGVLM